MIPLLALVAAAAGPVGPASPKPSQAQFESCVAQTDTDPAGAIAAATAWWKANGGVPAGQCLGIAYSAGGAWTSAAAAFSDAAQLAVEQKDGRAANLWVSAGNAALAGGDVARAKVALGNAIALPVLSDTMRGEAYLDLARANVAGGELPAARSAMEQALKLVAADPMAWLLSATLARRMGDTARATTDIDQADSRAPNEAPILFEMGNILATAGDLAKAREAWVKAKTLAPQSEAGQAAAKELAANGGDVPVKQLPVGR